jgi:peptidoglycan/LPS O-acetylase OafA/YrhL
VADSDRGEFSGVPTTVRGAGGLVALEGGVAVIVAIVLIVRGLLGFDQTAASGYGTAAWFGILGGAVLAAGIGLLLGKRWGRAIAVIAQLLLLPVTWSLLTDSHQPVFGVLLGVVVIAALVLLFAPPSSRWMAHEYGVDIED